MAFLDSVKQGVANFAMRFSGTSSWWYNWVPRETANYQQDVGDGRGNSIVVACIGWVQRVFPEAPVQVIDVTGPQPQAVDNHEMVKLINRPNPFYSGELLWQATLADWMATGNAYWIVIRNKEDKPIQLWYTPSFLLEPKWNSDTDFISYYEYKPSSTTEPVPLRPQDVIHFRNGIDPKNIRKGLSKIGALVRTLFIDNEAERFSASLLGNLGVPGVVIIPEEGTKINTTAAEETKAKFNQKFGGERRGEPLVMSSRVKVEVLSFSPDDMNFYLFHKLPEERASAIFGTPAVVVGLGAGLDRSTFENFAEAREAAYESMIIPTQRLFAADLRHQLLPNFEVDADTKSVGFDLSEVRILQPDQDSIYRRTERALRTGWITMNEARIRTGYDALPNGNLFYLPPNAVIVEQSLLTSILPASAVPADNILNPENNPGDTEVGDGTGTPAIIMPKQHFPRAMKSYIIRELEPVVGNGSRHD